MRFRCVECGVEVVVAGYPSGLAVADSPDGRVIYLYRRPIHRCDVRHESAPTDPTSRDVRFDR